MTHNLSVSLAPASRNPPWAGAVRRRNRRWGRDAFRLEAPLLTRLTVLFLLCAIGVSASAQTLRFYAVPYRVNEGDSVTFKYIEATNTLPRSAIASWKWDFNGDGIVDATSATQSDMNATWVAALDRNLPNDAVQYVSPILHVTLTGGGTLSVTNITEPVSFRPDRDLYLAIVPRATGNPDLSASFAANPRLLTTGGEVRFFADLKPNREDLRVQRIEWDFGDNTPGAVGSSPVHQYGSASTNTVSMTVLYSVSDRPTNFLTRTAEAFIVVVPDAGKLSLGRSYRRGFPAELGWEDVIENYSTPSGSGDSYVYFHYLTDAFYDFTADASGFGTNSALGRERLTETVNELLQGQTLLGNQRLINALRMKYPRLDTYDPLNPPPKLPEPPGAREETLALDVALLDFQAGLFYAFTAITNFGPDILRSRATPVQEPFPDFPGYLTFSDPSLSQLPIPIKNEYWQLTTALDRVALGTVEKAKKLFNLSIVERPAREESKEACKKAGLYGYLGMALLATGQSTNDFVLNQGNSLLAHVKTARDLFEGINAGLNPIGNDGSYIPNESFQNTYAAAQEAVTDARAAEIEARQEDRTYDQYQADLRNELQSQRAAFITPLRNLTGLEPGDYNNLATVPDQLDFRNTVNQRVNALLAAYPIANPQGLGEYGAQVISILDSGEEIQQAINRLNNIYESIKIAEWANTEIQIINNFSTAKLKANDIARGYANAFSFSTTISSFFGSFSVNFSPGSIISGYLNAEDRDIQLLQQARIGNVQLQEQIRSRLLEVANLAIDIRRAKNRLDQEKLRLDQMLSSMDRYIEDLAHARLTAENLYFQDPSFRIVVSNARRRADGELDYAIDRLYRLAKTLEYEWTEPYQNPVVVPIGCQEAPSLENPLFDKFTALESLFITRSADESKDYLDALRAWNSKLRRINVTSVRGPNHAGPITAEPISMRALKTPVTTEISLEASIHKFRDYLRSNLQENDLDTANPSLEFTFATSITDKSMFPYTGSRWNMRIATVQVDLVAERGFSTKQVAEVELIESGIASLRRFFAEPPLADDLRHFEFRIGTRSDRTVYGIAVPAKINGALGGRPPTEFTVTGLAGRPIAATTWVLRIDTNNPSNRDIDFSKLKDIVLRFTYTYGNPPEFVGF